MLGDLQVLEIQVMYKQGKKLKEIARITGYSINTVRKYARDHKESGYSQRGSKPQKLDGFRDYLKVRVKQGEPNWLPATVLYDEIKALGYEGGISLLRAYLATLKPKVKERVFTRFETSPGEQMQVDFAHFNFNDFKFYAFVAVLGYSRMLYIEFVENQKIETLLKCHENSFEYFGGVPGSIVYDNMKSVVIKRNAYGEGGHKLQSNFYDFAKHYGFMPWICRPYDPQSKGKVERAISYLRNSFYNPFIAGKVNIHLDKLNTAAYEWLNSKANLRTHGTTNEEPIKRWEAEKELLQQVPINYLSNYGVKNLLQTKQSLQDMINKNNHSLQHDLSIYESLISLGGQA
jgi:transposase